MGSSVVKCETFNWYFTQASPRTQLILSLTFFIVIFLLLAFLYFRFAVRRNSQRLVDDEESRGQIRHVAELVISPQEHVGLDAKIISALPIFMFKLLSSENDVKKLNYMESECSICLGSYEDEEIVKVMPKCHHGFHSPCLDEWLGNRSTCPLCRSSIDSSTSILTCPNLPNIRR